MVQLSLMKFHLCQQRQGEQMGEQMIEMVDLPPLFPHLPLGKVIFERFVPPC